jgi:lipopolysaccharide export system permease protein
MSSELDVMRAVGLSYTRLLRVPFLIAILLAGVNLLIVGYVQPLARYYYEQLDFELRTGALGASIKVGEFNTLKDRMSLRIEQSRDDGRELVGIFARVTEENGEVLSIAHHGRFLALQENLDT